MSTPPTSLEPLSVVLRRAPHDHQLVVGIRAWRRDREWRLAAVLDRVVVLEDPCDRWADRHTAPHRDVLARLRDHVSRGGRIAQRCEGCDPARGIYCWQVRDVAERFYELRRDEVMAARLEMAGGAR